MLVPSAEESYRNGRRAWEEGRRREAMAYFEAALELEKRLGDSGPQARYLSFYGLCLGLVSRQFHEGIRFCQKARSLEAFDPDICRNLARVFMAAGQRKKAHSAFVKGLRLQPDHPGIRSDMVKMGTRKRPVIKFLSRDNPLNVYLGKRRRGRQAGPRHKGNTAATEQLLA